MLSLRTVALAVVQLAAQALWPLRQYLSNDAGCKDGISKEEAS